MSYNSMVAADSPAGWWQLSDSPGSSAAADSSGNGHAMTATSVTFGAGGLPAGMTGTCASFDGAASVLIENSWAGPASSPFSIEIWLNVNSTSEGNFAAFINQDNFSSTNKGWILQNNFGTVQFGVANGAAHQSINGGSIGSSGWIHLAGTYDGTTMTLYVNGVSAGTAALAGPMVPGASGIQIGNQNAGNLFSGLLAQGAAYSTALSGARVLAHYNAGITPAPPTPPLPLISQRSGLY